MGRRKASTTNAEKNGESDLKKTSKTSNTDAPKLPVNSSPADPPKTGEDGGGGITAWLNLSTLSFLLVGFYLYTTITSMRSLIFPFEGIEIVEGAQRIKPLWNEKAPLKIYAYMSTSSKPNLKAFNNSDGNLPMLWEVGGDEGLSYGWETSSLEKRLELIAPDDLGVLAQSEAESRLAAKVAHLDESGGSFILMAASFLFDENTAEENQAEAAGHMETVSGTKIWKAVREGKAVYLHVHVILDESIQDQSETTTLPTTTTNMKTILQDQTKSLYGTVPLVKFEAPTNQRTKRWLLQDIGLGFLSGVSSWPNEETLLKRMELANRRKEIQDRKSKGLEPLPVPKWKPEVAVRMVVDVDDYPVGLGGEHSIAKTPKAFQAAGPALQELGSRVIRLSQGLFHKPLLHVDEIGLTSDKYLEMNSTIGSLPLKLSYSPMASSRHRLMRHFEHALSSQKEFGFAETDIDDVRRLISDTSVYLLTVTMLASVLHLLFEFLAFKSDITFWKNNKSLRGLSVRTLFMDLFVQTTITLYLADMDSSLLVLVPSALGVLIQGWKCQRATGLKLTFIGGYPSLRMNRVEDEKEIKRKKKDTRNIVSEINGKDGKVNQNVEVGVDEDSDEDDEAAETARKTAETMKIDRIAIAHLSMALFPLVIGFSLRSLIMEEHHGWYSWAIASLTGTCYTFGFILMTPQLFINHHLKSVSHLPWKFLCFRFVNTFIDDLFAFVIRMPTMHRISCFRDDLVFFIYLYQRWVYPVDKSRGVAFEDLGS